MRPVAVKICALVLLLIPSLSRGDIPPRPIQKNDPKITQLNDAIERLQRHRIKVTTRNHNSNRVEISVPKVFVEYAEVAGLMRLDDRITGAEPNQPSDHSLRNFFVGLALAGSLITAGIWFARRRGKWGVGLIVASIVAVILIVVVATIFFRNQEKPDSDKASQSDTEPLVYVTVTEFDNQIRVLLPARFESLTKQLEARQQRLERDRANDKFDKHR